MVRELSDKHLRALNAGRKKAGLKPIRRKKSSGPKKVKKSNIDLGKTRRKLEKKIKERKIYDVLIWNDPRSKMEEPDDPTGMVNITFEHIGLTEKEAYKIYNKAPFYFKQIIKYESEDEDADGDVIEEEEGTIPTNSMSRAARANAKRNHH